MTGISPAVRRRVRMGFAQVCIAVATLAGVSGKAAIPAAAQEFVDRSAQCIAFLKRENPGTRLRAGLSSQACGLATPPAQFTGAAKHAHVASGAACSSSLPELPKCGREAALSDSTPSLVSRVPLGGGRCLHVLPLVMTDKTDGFTCNAVRFRPACVRGIASRDGKTYVTLGDGRERTAITADIVIDGTPEHHQPVFARASQGPVFVLLPADVTISGDLRDSSGFLAHYVERTRETCQGSAAHCREQALYQADRAAGELIRRVWTPRPLVAKEDRKKDFDEFAADIAARDLGRFNKQKQLFARLILENEVSGSSPYQMLDAVIRNSGLSWGAHQIDIGANSGEEPKLFWDTLRAWRRAPGTGDYPSLRKADRHRACLSQPIRNMFTEHLSLLFEAVPDMTRGMRATASRDAYKKRFVAYLDEEVPEAARLKGLFQHSPFAWIYFIDVRNQRGAGKARKLREIGEALDDDAPSCSDVAEGEASLVDYIKSITDEGDHYDIDRRVKNIRDFLDKKFGHGLGRNCS